MNVLVTGARGFLGHAIVEYILRKEPEWKVCCPKRPFKDQDRLRDLGFDLPETLETVDVIIHAAGNPSSIDCISDPSKAVQDNVTLTLETLEYARHNNVKHFIYISSVEVYGQSGVVDETTQCITKNPYAATKLAGEHLCTAYYHTYGLPCTIVRVNNTFGPRCQPERFPVLAIKKLLRDEQFVLHCDEDGNIGKRRWTPVYDVADMILFLIKRNKPGGIYNVTSDLLISNLELLERIASAMNKTFRYSTCQENIKGRILFQDATPDAIRSIGWTPKKSFQEHMIEFVNWTLW